MNKEELANKTAELSSKIKKKQPAIVKEFGEFINRGNIVDLAVGVIIGGAFSTIVSSLVDDIIMPLVGTIIGGVNFANLEITVPNIFGSGDAAHITYGNFLQNVVDFLIVAGCIFFFVRFINKLATKKKDAGADATEKASEKQQASDAEMLAVLKDIRSELKKSNK